MNQLTLQKYIDLAVKQLDHLDPILGYDLKWICATRPIDGRLLTAFYNVCLSRSNVWQPGTMRQAWNNVLDCLTEISHAEANK